MRERYTPTGPRHLLPAEDGITLDAAMDIDDPTPAGEVTRLLRAARNGDRSALDRIVPYVYEELREIADRQIRRQRPGQTLRATDLVHESYLKLARGGAAGAGDREHFLAIASRAMRQVLVDRARRRLARKRGGGRVETTLTESVEALQVPPEDLLGLDHALETLDPRQRRVVECRFFGGMEEQEIAAALDISIRTVRRDWVKARAWLNRELSAGA